MFKLFNLNLQLFAEGGEGAGTGAEGTTGVSETAAGSQTKGEKNSNPLANVVYGKQPTAETPAAEEVKETATVDRNAEFEKLIKGEYKDLYDARMQDTIRKRLKANEETVNRYNALTPTLERLAKKYGADPNDIDAINKAIDDDKSLWEEEALEHGMTVDQYKQFRTIQKENDTLKAAVAEREKQEHASAQYGEWMRQAEQTKGVYSQFDLNAELQNPKFVELLNSNVDVKTAYEVMHMHEIIPSAMQFAAQTTKQQVVNSVVSGNKRPSEGGMKSNSAAVVKSDVSQLSKADREEIIRRVQRGERISF